MPVASEKQNQTPLSTQKKMKKTPKNSEKAKKVGQTPQGSKENLTPSNTKTAVDKKSVKKESKKDGLVLKHESQLPDKQALSKFVGALMQVDRKVSESKDGKQLFDEDGIPLALQITGIKLPRDDRKQILKVRLPHCVIQPPRDVCLITKDLKKGLREDHEDSVNHFKDLMEEKGVSTDVVSEVISLRQLKVEYKQYETKLSLVKRYDVFLADTRIVRFLPKFLGKPFYARKKFPVPINLRSDNLKEEINRGIHTVNLPLSHHGTTSRVVFGNSRMSESDITENLAALLEVVGTRYPGGVKNIRSLHIKTDVSPAIPIHVNTASGNDLGFVDADIPNKVSREVVTGELSTQPGMEVTITPHGTIKVKKTGDPLWDDEKDEPFVSGSEEEDEEEEKKEQKKEQPKKRKVEEEKKDKKNAKKSKKENESDDSEDEDIKESEKAYMKRSRNEDQEEEEKEQKTAKKQKKEKKGAKKEIEPVKGDEKKSPENPSKKNKKDGKKQKEANSPEKESSSDNSNGKINVSKSKTKAEEKEPKKDSKKVKAKEEVQVDNDEWTDADSDAEQGEEEEAASGGEESDEGSELEFTDGSDEEESDDSDSEKITEVYDDEQELDAKDVIVDSDDSDEDAEDASDDRIMLDPKLKGKAEAAQSSDEETPKKAKKMSKNQKRKQRQEEKLGVKPQQKQKKTAKQQSPAQNKKSVLPATKKSSSKKPVPVKPTTPKVKLGKKR